MSTVPATATRPSPADAEVIGFTDVLRLLATVAHHQASTPDAVARALGTYGPSPAGKADVAPLSIQEQVDR